MKRARPGSLVVWRHKHMRPGEIGMKLWDYLRKNSIKTFTWRDADKWMQAYHKYSRPSLGAALQLLKNVGAIKPHGRGRGAYWEHIS